jgi:hypothetical protein
MNNTFHISISNKTGATSGEGTAYPSGGSIKKMIIVRNDNEITCVEAINRRSTGNTLIQKKRDK